jgi:primosomal replication protein N
LILFGIVAISDKVQESFAGIPICPALLSRYLILISL